jgi:hypothetical protein
MSFEELLRRPRKKLVAKFPSRSRKRMTVRGGLIMNKPPALCATALVTEQVAATALMVESLSATALVTDSFSATALVRVC